MKITVDKFLDINAHNYPFREAVVFEDRRADFAGLNLRVNQKANAFLSLGIKKGTHVGTLFANCLEVVESIFALLRIGAVVVPLNIRLSPTELEYVVDQSDVSALVFQDRLEEVARKIQPACPKGCERRADCLGGVVNLLRRNLTLLRTKGSHRILQLAQDRRPL